MAELFEAEIQSRKYIWPRISAWLIVAFIVAMHAAFQGLLNPIGLGQEDLNIWLGFGLMGALISQPILFGVWAGLGPGPLVFRLPATYAIVIALTLTGAVKRWNLWWPPNQPSSIAMDDLLWVSCFFVLVMGLMLLARKFFAWRIASPDEVIAEAQHSQFSLKFLLGMTAVCAVLLGIGRGLVSTSAEAAILAGLLLLILFPVLVLPFVTLSIGPSLRLIVLLPIAWSVLTWLGIEAMAAMENRPRAETAGYLISFQLGAAIASLSAAIALRLGGFRFTANSRARKARQVVDASGQQ